MAAVFPNPLRRSTVGFQIPKTPQIDLGKIKAAVATTAREAGPLAGREASRPVPAKRDFQLRLY